MGKYDPLERFLRRQTADEVAVTFGDIEQIVGFKLPPSRLNRAWWSNNPTNNVMTRAWLDAGFQTEQVDIAGRKLVFRKVAAEIEVSSPDIKSPAMKIEMSKEHPLFARLQGTGSIPEGVDVTEPADPEWGASAYGDDVFARRG